LRDGSGEWGVKGMIPACCLPLWGREGVTLIASTKCKKMRAATGFLQSPDNCAELGQFAEALIRYDGAIAITP